MKQFLTQYKYYLLLMFIINIASCQDDEALQNQSEKNEKIVLDFKAKKIEGYKLFQENKDLDRLISVSFLNGDAHSENLNSSLYNFTIDTTNVQVISSDIFDSYSFIVEREETEISVLENYILTLFNDGSYAQMLIKYPFSIVNEEIQYDFDSAIADYIFDDNLLLSESDSPCPSTSEEIIAWEDGGCVAVNCGLAGDHSPGEACDDGEVRAHWNCGGAWVVTGCVYTSGGTYTGGTDPSNNTTNGGSDNNNNDDDMSNEEIPVIPFIDFGKRAECNKIKNLLDDNPNYKQQLINLDTKRTLNHETAIGVYEDNTEFESTGTIGDNNVYLQDNPSSKFKSIAHVHNEYSSPTNTIKTYSIFSIADLEVIAKKMKGDKLSSSKFVAFLTTGKNTRYAFTISSANKFRNFFKYLDVFEKAAAGEKEKAKELSNYYNTVVTPIFNKYFYYTNPPDPFNAPIKITNTNNHQVLLAFLNFMKETDIGITLFKVNANYDNFEKLTLNKAGTNFENENCN